MSNERKYQDSVASIVENCDRSSLRLRASTRHSIAEAYNSILSQVRELTDVEALVLLHEDVEILDHRFEEKVRRILRERPQVGLIGAIGGRGVTSLKWWRGEVVGRVFETRGVMTGVARSGDVDTVDGFLMVLAPRAFQELGFDESISGFHGYDGDYCAQVRNAGMSVTVADLAVAHHSKGGYGNLESYRKASIRFSEKWGYPRPRLARLDGWVSAFGNFLWRAIMPAKKSSDE